MKRFRLPQLAAAIVVLLCLNSCTLSKKSGCSSNGKNVGAERILSGEKVKAKKFKA